MQENSGGQFKLDEGTRTGGEAHTIPPGKTRSTREPVSLRTISCVPEPALQGLAERSGALWFMSATAGSAEVCTRGHRSAI